ncbi:hypothetical protein ACH5RR_024494 [Cinchona calisaya]|uniref:Uncharacterized protein n=1 Tax=Cinchona calisaya TaxID=153742 RepID=A0ABD2Z012_9GENT
MTKDKNKPNSSSSNDWVRFSPYSKNCRKIKKIGDEKKGFEDARCPICMEHPHNAVLIICSSHEKGCRPYICDTSRRHSNCLDQFCKLNSVIPLKSTDNHQPNKFASLGEKQEKEGLIADELVCPLCRGKISGWIVEDSARRYINSISRNCALEKCEFSGNYDELRKHARVEHPLARPSEADEERLASWDRLEEELLDDEDVEYYDDFSDEDFDDREEEVNLEPLYPGDDFFNHIHFGDENDAILEEDYSINNGILRYTRKTTTGKFYEFAMVLE